MTYKEQKLKEFCDSVFNSKVKTKDQALIYRMAIEFMASTIEEILECLPKKATPRYNDKPDNYFYDQGFKNCRLNFLNNLKQKIKNNERKASNI